MVYSTSTAMAEFDCWSRTYDTSLLQRFFFRPSHDLILANLRPSDERILDLGCGTCQFAAELARRLPRVRVFGLDLSAKMLEHGARRRHAWKNRLAVVRGDSGRLPFADGTFDAVTCSHSFHHYPNQPGAVAEMHRVLRHEGRLLIVDGDRDGLWGRFVFDLLVTTLEGEVHHCSGRRFRELFTQAGFRQVRVQHSTGLLPFLLTMGDAHKPAAAAAEPLRRKAA